MHTLTLLEGTLLARALDEAPPENDCRPALRCRTALGRLGWTQAHHRAVGLLDADGRFLARADQFRLEGLLKGRRIQICGIGGIIETPLGADHGAAELVSRVAVEAAADGVEVALISSSQAWWPESAGFRDLDVRDLSLRVAEGRRGAPMVPVRSGERRDFAHIGALPALGTDDPARLRLNRSVDLLDFAITRQRVLAGVAPDGARQLHFLVAEEGMRAVAYIVVSVSHEGWWLQECGDADPTGARVGALLQALLADAPAERRPTITAWLPTSWLPPQLTVATVTPSATRMFVKALGGPLAGVDLAAATASLWHGDPPCVV